MNDKAFEIMGASIIVGVFALINGLVVWGAAVAISDVTPKQSLLWGIGVTVGIFLWCMIPNTVCILLAHKQGNARPE